MSNTAASYGSNQVRRQLSLELLFKSWVADNNSIILLSKKAVPMSTQLRCPWCNTQGINHIGSYLLEPAVITYCRKCMAIRGVLPLIFPAPSNQ